MRKKETNFFALMNPVYMKKKINELGGDGFHPGRYILYLLLGIIGVIAIGFVMRLTFWYTAILVVLSLFLLPSFFYIENRNKYEKKRFVDVSAYLEQLLYSFKRQPKILTSLRDARIIFEDEEGGNFHKVIGDAIEHIQYGSHSGEVYEEAFKCIEDEYGCKRMSKIHKFLSRVETAGGESEEPVEMLLVDRNLWVSRIQSLLQDKKKIRTNVTIGIGLSLLVVALSVYMIPTDFGIYLKPASQIARTVTIALDMLIWYFVQVALGKSLLDVDKDIPFEEIEHSYNIVMKGQPQSKKMSFLVVGVMCLVGAVICFLTLGIGPGVVLALFALLMATQPNRQYKACVKRVQREVEKAFPDWLLSLALQMQTDNVHVSIVKTTLTAPRILMEELMKLQDGIEKYPDELAPYSNFFKQLSIPDIQTAMKMLYSMEQFGSQDSQAQIKALVDRNTEIMDKAERMKIEDHLAGVSFMMLLPMITGVISMLTDLALVMGYLLSQVNF